MPLCEKDLLNLRPAGLEALLRPVCGKALKHGVINAAQPSKPSEMKIRSSIAQNSHSHTLKLDLSYGEKLLLRVVL